jgi:CBS domain-containing protein
MLLKEIMTSDPECIFPDDTLQEAARKMRDLDIGPLPVCGANKSLSGMITDRDIIIRAVAEGKDPRTTPVREAMTGEIIACFEDQDAARTMQERQVRRLVVLNRDKTAGRHRLVGRPGDRVGRPAGGGRGAPGCFRAIATPTLSKERLRHAVCMQLAAASRLGSGKQHFQAFL